MVSGDAYALSKLRKNAYYSTTFMTKNHRECPLLIGKQVGHFGKRTGLNERAYLWIGTTASVLISVANALQVDRKRQLQTGVDMWRESILPV